MKSKVYDAIIVGAGHNGLVAANYLSKAGKKVLVLEKRHLVGGAAVTEELVPGFKFSRFSYVLSLFRRSIINDLDLTAKGLKIHFRDVSSLTPTKQAGKYLLMYAGDSARTRAEISKFSRKDADAWESYNKTLNAICDFWDKRIEMLPYNYIQKPTLKDKYLFLKSLIMRGIHPFDLSKFVTSSVENVLNKWFQSQILKATLATDGIIGENLSINSTSTAYILLHHVMGELELGRKGDWGYVEGGNGKLSSILAQSAESYGATIRVNAAVRTILYSDKKPIGVQLEDGEQLLGTDILSNCTHKITFEKLIPNVAQLVDVQTFHKLKSIEYNGASTKINLALNKLPKFKCFSYIEGDHSKLLTGTIHVNCEDLQSLKNSFKQTRKHRISRNPFMDITIPSTLDKTICPEGYHIMNVLLQYTPYHPNSDQPTTEISHQEVKETFLRTLNQYLQEPLDVHYMDILTPFDLERVLNMTEGNIFHGAIGLDNLYVNRISGNIAGVWVCGSSGHPGGGVMGAVGKQIAQQILRKSS